MSADFVAALYEAALDPEGLRPLMALVGNYLGIDGMTTCLTEDLLLDDASLNLDIAASQRAYLHYLQDRATDSNDIHDVSSGMPPDRDCLAAGAVRGLDVEDSYPISEMRPSPFACIGPGASARPAPQELKTILPHLRRALMLRLRNRSTTGDPQALVFAELTFGAVICDGGGHVLRANSAADVLMSNAKCIVIKTKDRTIAAVSTSDTTKLTQLIHQAATMHRSGGLVLAGRDGMPCLIALVTPLEAQKSSETSSRLVLVALRPIDGSPAFSLARLSELFRLSPAQATLAIGLYEGKSFEQIASERGVKVTTLRTHFAEVLSRTGSRSLRDLVRLLGSIPPLR